MTRRAPAILVAGSPGSGCSLWYQLMFSLISNFPAGRVMHLCHSGAQVGIFSGEGEWPAHALIPVRDPFVRVASAASDIWKTEALGAYGGGLEDASRAMVADVIETVQRLAIPWLFVPYEALVARPEPFLREVLGWLGIDQELVPKLLEVHPIRDANEGRYRRGAVRVPA
jgi:hypothetical protein